MEAFWAIAKIFGTLALTAVINKLFSLFRVRQLYLSCDDVMPCYDKGVTGFTSTLIIFNRGKDSEKEIEVIFPSATIVQLLSASAQGVTAVENKILIDRILSRDEVKLSVYISGNSPLTYPGYPVVKSVEANGKVFFKRSNVPPSWGPFFGGMSFFAAILIAGFYLSYTGQNPSDYYYKLRYSYMYERGIEIGVAGDNALVSKGSSRSPTIDVLDVSQEDNKMVFAFNIRNPFSRPIYVSVYSVGRSDYWEQSVKLRRAGLDPDAQPEIKRLKESLWITNLDYETSMDDFKIMPDQTDRVYIKKSFTANADLEKLKLYVSVDGVDEDGDGFKDFYGYYPYRGKDKERILEIIRSAGSTATK